MSHMTYAEQQRANKKDFKSGISMTVLSVTMMAVLFIGIAKQLGG